MEGITSRPRRKVRRKQVSDRVEVHLAPDSTLFMPTAIYGWGSNLYGQLGLLLTETETCRAQRIHSGGPHDTLAAVTASQVVWQTAPNRFTSQGLGLSSSDEHTNKEPLQATETVQLQAKRLLGCDRIDGYLGIDGRIHPADAPGSVRHGPEWLDAATNVIGQVLAISTSGEPWLFPSLTCSRTADGVQLQAKDEQIPPVHAVAGGGAHFVMVTEDPKCPIYACGDGRYGQLGAPALQRLPETRDAVKVGYFSARQGFTTRIAAVECGSRHSVALTVDGDAYFWGWLIVNGVEMPLSPTPIMLGEEQLDRQVIQVACGAAHTLLLLDDGSLWGFGSSTWPRKKAVLTPTDEHGELGFAQDRPRVGSLRQEEGECILPECLTELATSMSGRATRVGAAHWTSYAQVEE